MRVFKNTTNFSNDFIHEVFSFVKPSNVKSSRVDLRLGNTKRTRHGKMHRKSWAWDNNYLEVFVQTDNTKFPRTIHRSINQAKRGYLHTGLLLSPIEAFVEVLAHEARHIYQENKKHKTRTFGTKRQRFNETDADIYAIQMIRKWRTSKYQDAIDMGIFQL